MALIRRAEPDRRCPRLPLALLPSHQQRTANDRQRGSGCHDEQTRHGAARPDSSRGLTEVEPAARPTFGPGHRLPAKPAPSGGRQPRAAGRARPRAQSRRRHSAARRSGPAPVLGRGACVGVTCCLAFQAEQTSLGRFRLSRSEPPSVKIFKTL